LVGSKFGSLVNGSLVVYFELLSDYF